MPSQKFFISTLNEYLLKGMTNWLQLDFLMQWQTAVQLEACSGATAEYEVPLSFIGLYKPVRAAVADILSLFSLFLFSFFLPTHIHTQPNYRTRIDKWAVGKHKCPLYPSPEDKIHEEKALRIAFPVFLQFVTYILLSGFSPVFSTASLYHFKLSIFSPIP